MTELQKRKTSLTTSVHDLQQANNALTKAKNEVELLTAARAELNREIERMERQKSDIASYIKTLESQVADLQELKDKHDSLLVDVAKLEVEIQSNRKQLDILHSFQGLIKASSFEDIFRFAKSLPDLLTDIKQKDYSPQLLRDYILETLSGRTLRSLRCTSCGAKFAADKPSRSLLGYHCPVCSSSLVNVIKDEGSILKSVMSLPVKHRVTKQTKTISKRAP